MRVIRHPSLARCMRLWQVGHLVVKSAHMSTIVSIALFPARKSIVWLQLTTSIVPAANSASAPISDLVQLSPKFKHPADQTSGQGVKISLAQKASTSYQWRTELIPHTFDGNYSKKGMINQGLVFYHFSMMRKDVNPPSTTQDHQMCYFENGHFVEMRYGLLGKWLVRSSIGCSSWWVRKAGSQDAEGSLLHAFINGESRWNSTWLPNVWHNIAYEIVSNYNKLSARKSTKTRTGFQPEYRWILAFHWQWFSGTNSSTH